MSILHPHNVPFQQPTIRIPVQDSHVVPDIIVWRSDAASNNHSTIHTYVFSTRVYLEPKNHKSTRSQNITAPHNPYTSKPTSSLVKETHNPPRRPSTGPISTLASKPRQISSKNHLQTRACTTPELSNRSSTLSHVLVRYLPTNVST